MVAAVLHKIAVAEQQAMYRSSVVVAERLAANVSHMAKHSSHVTPVSRSNMTAFAIAVLGITSKLGFAANEHYCVFTLYLLK